MKEKTVFWRSARKTFPAESGILGDAGRAASGSMTAPAANRREYAA